MADFSPPQPAPWGGHPPAPSAPPAFGVVEPRRLVKDIMEDLVAQIPKTRDANIAALEQRNKLTEIRNELTAAASFHAYKAQRVIDGGTE